MGKWPLFLQEEKVLLTSTVCAWYSLAPEAGVSVVLAWATASVKPFDPAL